MVYCPSVHSHRNKSLNQSIYDQITKLRVKFIRFLVFNFEYFVCLFVRVLAFVSGCGWIEDKPESFFQLIALKLIKISGLDSYLSLKFQFGRVFSCYRVV
jgi:hypothetical protein